MMAPRTRWLAGIAGAVALAAAAAFAFGGASRDPEKTELGLFSSLPIYWLESADIAETLDGNGQVHWVRSALEQESRLLPLDTLDGDELGRLERLFMAQPRPLAPPENVALDDWVRGGGRLLLFADPMSTEHSRFGLGDRRRPQDAVVLSPILRRWGIELMFDDAQSDALRTVRFAGVAIPVRLAGSFRAVSGGEAAECDIGSDSVIARCRIGEGAVLMIADAAVLSHADGDEQALRALTEAAFAQ